MIERLKKTESDRKDWSPQFGKRNCQSSRMHQWYRCCHQFAGTHLFYPSERLCVALVCRVYFVLFILFVICLFCLLFLYFVCFLSIGRLCVALVCRVYSPNVAPCHQCHQCHSVKGSSARSKPGPSDSSRCADLWRSLTTKRGKRSPSINRSGKAKKKKGVLTFLTVSGQHTHNMCHCFSFLVSSTNNCYIKFFCWKRDRGRSKAMNRIPPLASSLLKLCSKEKQGGMFCPQELIIHRSPATKLPPKLRTPSIAQQH